jgi:putative ATP-binding cassette transporter
MVGDWLGGTAYHRMRFVSSPWTIPISAFSRTSRLMPRTHNHWPWARVLVGVSGFLHHHFVVAVRPLTVFGLQIPRAMVFLAYIYVIIATVLAFRIGRPLIRLNFLNELLTASYRYNLVRIRDNSENIAFYRASKSRTWG